MAFGESLGIIEDRINQVKSQTSWPTGQLDQTVFETKDPLVAESIMHIFDVSPPLSYHLLLQCQSHVFANLSHLWFFVLESQGKIVESKEDRVRCTLVLKSLDVTCHVPLSDHYPLFHTPSTFVS